MKNILQTKYDRLLHTHDEITLPALYEAEGEKAALAAALRAQQDYLEHKCLSCEGGGACAAGTNLMEKADRLRRMSAIYNVRGVTQDEIDALAMELRHFLDGVASCYTVVCGRFTHT